MNESRQPVVMPIQSPWRSVLLSALSHIQHRLLIVCPYIKEEVVTAMKLALLSRVRADDMSLINAASTAKSAEKDDLMVRIITRVDPDELLAGSSDITALQQLLAWPTDIPSCRVEMRAIPNVHAKVWVCDTQVAIVGSGNATPSGLDSNLEYGLAVYDTQLIECILSDWQPYWEQAEHVERETLDDIAQALQKVKQSDVVLQSQAQKKIVQQELSAIAHLGKRITFKKASTSSILKEQPQAISVEASDKLTAITQAYTHATVGDPTGTSFADAITIPASDFWRALCWVVPGDEDGENMIVPEKQPGSSLKLAWRAVPTDQQTLQFIWADGRRYSQASLLAPNAVHQHSWAITLNAEQLNMFEEMLQDLRKAGFFTEISGRHFHIVLNTERYDTLSIAYQRDPRRKESGEAMVLPCTQASIPGSFPQLRPPISRITVAHRHLYEALITLSRQWETMYSTSEPLAIIELSFGQDTIAYLALSTGQIEAPLTQRIEGTDCLMAGPEIMLRLDYAALHQVLASGQGNVQSWQLCTGRNADTLQCIPAQSTLSETALVWRHELRGLS